MLKEVNRIRIRPMIVAVAIGSLVALSSLVAGTVRVLETFRVDTLAVDNNATIGSNLALGGALSGGTGYVTSGPETMPGTTITVTDTGTQDNYNPSGLSTANIIRANNASSLTIDGIVGGTDGRVLTICAVSGQTVTLANEAAGSTAANRIWATNNQNSTLASSATTANACAQLLYDSTSSRWRMTAANTDTFASNLVFAGTTTANGAVTDSAGLTVSGSQIVLSTATGHISTVGATVPVLSSCGTGSPTIHGSDIAGRLTTGTTATTCTLTFGATYTNPPACIVTAEGTATEPTYTNSATTIVMSVDIASTTYDYYCVKVQ